MPRSICDSEDEGEVLYEEQTSQRSTYSQCIAYAEEVLSNWPPSLDGANDQHSSLSTGENDLRIHADCD